MRHSSREVTAVKRHVPPRAATVPTAASVATPTWCPCLHTTTLAAVLKETFSTMPLVSSNRIQVGVYTHINVCIYMCVCVSVPCCPESISVSAVSTDTLEIMWAASRGAELYETRAVDSSEVILCNDTAPVCALSDLSCDSSYSVMVTPCNEISGCNRACTSHTRDTGRKPLFKRVSNTLSYFNEVKRVHLQLMFRYNIKLSSNPLFCSIHRRFKQR